MVNQSKTSVRLDDLLLSDVKSYLIDQYGVSSDLSPTTYVTKALRLLLYNSTEAETCKAIIKQRLQEVGATEEDYLKGRVRTWARRTNLMEDQQEEDSRVSPKMDQVIRQVLKESQEEEDNYELSHDNLFREEGEEITPPSYNKDTPPWNNINKLTWEQVYALFPYKENPFVTWCRNKDGTWNMIRCEAVKAALYHVPPADRTTEGAWKVIYELEKRFREWKEDYND